MVCPRSMAKFTSQECVGQNDRHTHRTATTSTDDQWGMCTDDLGSKCTEKQTKISTRKDDSQKHAHGCSQKHMHGSFY